MAPLGDWFVDRARQLLAFRHIVEGQIQRRIMVIQADEGMGKTWLLQTYAREAAARNLPHTYIDFSDGQTYDALSLMLRFRDDLGDEQFPRVNAVLEAAIGPQLAPPVGVQPLPAVNINVEGSTLNNSPISVQNVGTLIKGNTFVFQTENSVIRQVFEARMTTAFFDDLDALIQHTTPVFLFDAYDRASTHHDVWTPNEAARWVAGQLLDRIREGRVGRLAVVVAGERVPPFGSEWNAVLGRMDLNRLECADVDEYLRQRRGLSTISDAEIAVLCQAVNGSPQVLGLIGDNLTRAKDPAAHDDEW